MNAPPAGLVSHVGGCQPVTVLFAVYPGLAVLTVDL
jgi:hypothetical protein